MRKFGRETIAPYGVPIEDSYSTRIARDKVALILEQTAESDKVGDEFMIALHRKAAAELRTDKPLRNLLGYIRFLNLKHVWVTINLASPDKIDIQLQDPTNN